MGAVLQRYIRLIGPNVIKADKPYTLGFSIVRARIRDELRVVGGFRSQSETLPWPPPVRSAGPGTAVRCDSRPHIAGVKWARHHPGGPVRSGKARGSVVGGSTGPSLPRCPRRAVVRANPECLDRSRRPCGGKDISYRFQLGGGRGRHSHAVRGKCW
jgi:hypothetical protein